MKVWDRAGIELATRSQTRYRLRYAARQTQSAQLQRLARKLKFGYNLTSDG